MKNYKLQFKIIISVVIGFILFPVASFAAILYLELPEEDPHKNDTFVANIKLNTEGEYINAVRVNFSFSQDILEIRDFSKGNSVLTVWLEEPQFSEEGGSFSFSGGIPGGYQGWDGTLGKVIFKAKEQGLAKIEFQESSQTLLNDGMGTPAKLEVRGAAFNLLPEAAEGYENQWQQELEKDTIPPEFFEIEISQQSDIFDGKYFIIFSTTDKQTGVSHYENKEDEEQWKVGNSPYPLEDQSLTSIITVRAVDKAGNKRISEIGPRYIPSEKPFPYWVVALAIFLMGLVGLLYKKAKK